MTAKRKPAKTRKQPVRYSEAIADHICGELAKGRSLNDICSDPGMPTESAVRWWEIDNLHGFAAKYARARDIGLDILADEILAIADAPKMGKITTKKSDGTEETRVGDMTEHRRMQIDARKWYLGKLGRKKYGESVDVNHSGSISIGERLKRAEERVKGST